MKFVDWSMQGIEVVNCNCSTGCPCQFNSRPTHGNCCAYGFIQIDRGHFGEVTLDGLRWGIIAAWPGAIHEGNGLLQTIIDERASPLQRHAIEAVSHGQETEPGTLIWQVFSTTVTRFLPTLYKPIEFSVDLASCTARMSVPGIVDGTVSPMLNPITGKEHHARICLPNGFEFTHADIVSGRGDARTDGIEMTFTGTHAHIAHVHWTTQGVVRPTDDATKAREVREPVAV